MEKFTSVLNKVLIKFKNTYFNNRVYGQIGENTSIGKNTLIDGNSIVGNENFINDNCMITKATIGNYCSIGANVVIGPGEHSLKMISNSGRFYSNTYDELTKESCNIGHDVWIGTYAIIMRGVNIGNGAIVGANAVVTRDVPPFAIVAGVPAKIIKYKFSEDVIKIILSSKWWNLDLLEAKKEIKRLENLCGIK